MASGIKSIISQLERQQKVVERALAALRDVGDLIGQPSAPVTAAIPETPAARRGGMTPAGRKRLAAAMKRRWAAKRTASHVPAKKTARKKLVAKPE